MKEMEEMAKKFLSELGTEAAKFNRKAGFDRGVTRQRVEERMRTVRTMLRRLLPDENATLKDFLQLVATRCAKLKRAVDAAEKEAPSIARFEKVIGVMSEVVLESARNQDHLFELSGAFRRGFDILAERPKQPKKVESSKDLLFTARERARFAKSITAFYWILVSNGRDCGPESILSGEPQIPEWMKSVVARHRPDKSVPLTKEVLKRIVLDWHFKEVEKGRWAYNGEVFRLLKRYSGLMNTEMSDPEDMLTPEAEPFLNLPLGMILGSADSKAFGLTLLSSMAGGDGTPEMASALANDAREEIMNGVLRKELAVPAPAESEKPTATLQGWSKFVGKLLKRKNGTWIKVEIGDGRQGWIEQRAIETI